MTHQNTLSAHLLPAQHSVFVLRQRESFELDTTYLSQLFAEKTSREAEEIVYRALEDIARRFDRLRSMSQQRDFASIVAVARRIASIAVQIGLLEAERAAFHIGKCAESEDDVSLAATIARLERAFDSAVDRLWEFHRYVVPKT